MVVRPSKASYYLGIARQVARRGTCLRRNFGAILVKNDQIIGIGYSGAPRGLPHCLDLKKCLREKLNIPSGERYELCRGVHAELNAIISAARAGFSTIDSVMFVAGAKDNFNPKPCVVCKRAIINAGIRRVILLVDNRILEYDVKQWIKDAIKAPFAELPKV